MTATLLLGESRSRLLLPVSSLIEEAGAFRVFRQKDAELFESRWVTLGRRQGEWVEVLAGVDLGDRVISRGAYFVKLASLNSQQIGHGHAH